MTVFKQSFELCERGISESSPASKKKLPAIGTAKRTPRLLYSHKVNIFSKNPPATSCNFSIFEIKWSHSKARRGKARVKIILYSTERQITISTNTNQNTALQELLNNPVVQALVAQATSQAVTAIMEANKKGDKKGDKTVDVVDEVTYRTQEFHKELKAVGMVSGKDYWVHTNEKGKTKLFACVHHSSPDWARKLEALGFIPTRAYGGSTPAFAIYCRTTGDLKVDLFKSDK